MKLPIHKLIFFVFFPLIIHTQSAFEIPAKPTVIYPVNDYTNVLTKAEIQQLNEKLIHYNDSTSTEIIIVLIKTLHGDDANYVGARWGEVWKIGQKDKNNGILVLLALDDRKMAIQVGRGVEDRLTDYTCSAIIEQGFKPYLKKGDVFQAVDVGTDMIIQALKGAFSNQNPLKAKKSPFANIFQHLLVWIFILVVLSSLIVSFTRGSSGTTYHRRGMHKSGGGWFIPPFGGGFSGGGGFGGFGSGGSFGGGGASGSW